MDKIIIIFSILLWLHHLTFSLKFVKKKFKCHFKWRKTMNEFKMYIFINLVHAFQTIFVKLCFVTVCLRSAKSFPASAESLQRRQCSDWTWTYLSQQLCSVVQVLPVDPGSQVVHHSLLDLLLDPLVRLSLQLQRLVVILPLKWKWTTTFLIQDWSHREMEQKSSSTARQAFTLNYRG